MTRAPRSLARSPSAHLLLTQCLLEDKMGSRRVSDDTRLAPLVSVSLDRTRSGSLYGKVYGATVLICQTCLLGMACLLLCRCRASRGVTSSDILESAFCSTHDYLRISAPP